MSKYIFVNRFFYPDHSATSQILSDLVFDLSKSDVDIHVVTSRYSYDNSFAVLPAKEKIGNVFIHRVCNLLSVGKLRFKPTKVKY